MLKGFVARARSRVGLLFLSSDAPHAVGPQPWFPHTTQATRAQTRTLGNCTPVICRSFRVYCFGRIARREGLFCLIYVPDNSLG
ncbi:hypothetical protein N9L68_02175, partial [bacterium]|nr:hypothetical protein [bacterium]